MNSQVAGMQKLWPLKPSCPVASPHTRTLALILAPNKPPRGISTIFTARKRSFLRFCFYTNLSVHRGWYPSMPCRCYPSMPWQVSRKGGVSQHAVQVSMTTPKGELEGSGWGSVVSQHALRQTPPGWRLLLRVVHILLECILVVSVFSQCWSFPIMVVPYRVALGGNHHL